jgi:hypothetical protein
MADAPTQIYPLTKADAPYQGPQAAAAPAPNQPTASLFGNKYTAPQLTYPESIGSGVSEGHLYPHAVKFYINVPNVTNSAVFQQVVGDSNLQGVIGQGTNNPSIAGSTVNPFSIAGSSVPTSNFSSVGVYASEQQANQTRIASTITLYMPDTVTESYDAHYDDINIADFKLNKLGQMAATAFDKTFGSSEGTIDWSALGLVSAGQTKAGNYYPTAAKAQSQGVAVNPNVQLLFRSIGLRQFQFEFMFSPKNANESAAVQNIIRMFKFHAAPEILGSFANTPNGDDVNYVASGLAFVIPSSFNVQFLYLNPKSNNWDENNNIHRIGNCVLENIAVDYAPNGWSTFTDGNPTQIRMNLQFKETTIVTKSEVTSGF